MDAKCYTVIGCKAFQKSLDGMVEFTQTCGSVTEVCRYLKKMYSLSEKECRRLIYTAFARNTKLWIQVDDERSVRISIHKMDGEIRLHGCW